MREDLQELSNNVKEELKRADHLLYVTLKYTRTVDVIKNFIKLLITALDFAIELYLKSKMNVVSKAPKRRADELLKKLPAAEDYVKFYLNLKKIDSLPYTKKEEYRKHVALITSVAEIDIEISKEYFEKTKEFVKFIEENI